MNFYKIIILCFVLQFNTSCLLFGQNVLEAKFDVKVQDEQKKALPNVKVKMYPMYYHENYTAVTDKNGTCCFKVKTDPFGSFRVEEKGYYRTSCKYDFSQDKNSYNKLLNRWEPYPSKITITLRKKKNPVPMYVKSTGVIPLPFLGKPVGFDLEKGDWVKPHGKGEIADFVIVRKLEKIGDKEKLSYILTFSNPLDGIQEYVMNKKFSNSQFQWPYDAFLKGYQQTISEYKIYKVRVIERKDRPDAKYIFRVRTKIDKNGKIISANYGKIIGGFHFSSDDGMKFTYYFNPDPNSRSLEFATDKNLFKKDKTHYQP